MHATVASIRSWLAARPRQADAVFALLILGATVLSSRSTVDMLRENVPGYEYDGTADLIGLALTCLPLALRRSAPFSSLVACCVGFVLSRQLFGCQEASMVTFALSVAFYSAAVHGADLATSRLAVAALAASGVLVLGEVAYELAGPEGEGAGLVFLLVAFAYNLALIVAMWVLGRLRASALRRNVELAERTRELVAERERSARRAVLDERVRIARELHDVVAHHVSVIGVQAGAARTVLTRDPDRAAEVLQAIEGESRSAVAELHRLLGVLRQHGDIDALAPQPGLAQLPALAAAVEQSGIEVSVEAGDGLLRLSPTVDASAYRIVQEALTNAIKHSGASAAQVRLGVSDDAFEVTVVDNGRGGAQHAPPGRGLGIVGMRERAALHGGTLEAGPRDAGGFEVRATFPLPAPGDGVPSAERSPESVGPALALAAGPDATEGPALGAPAGADR